MHKKHPDPQIPPKSALLVSEQLPMLEDVEITGAHILKVARTIQGGVGPGGSDASIWQEALLQYGAHSEWLRESVASLSRRISNSIVPWYDLRALMASRMIALDKCPGVRPIGIGETLRRIIGKTVCLATKGDIEGLCGVSQLCAGTAAGIEGAVHAINELFEEKKTGWMGSFAY